VAEPVRDPATVDPVIARARRDWKKADDGCKAQRDAILAAKKFRALEQWPEAIKLARGGNAAIQGQPPQPERPCLTVDRLSQPVRAVSNTIKNADFGFDVLPNGTGADVETGQILKGYLRRVQNQSRGESPIEWAADGAVEGGIGWFEINTRYVHETWEGEADDPEAYDQELVLERVPNTLAVYDDPHAVKPTRSDALFRFFVEDRDRDAVLSEFPDIDERDLDSFCATGEMRDWASKDTIRVAKYWCVDFETREIKTVIDGRELKRTIRAPKVNGYLITATKVLKKFAWVGSRIPSVPVLGEELNVDGKSVLRGIIAMGMDAQRMVNFTYSAAVEIFALQPKKAPRVAAASIVNYKQVWDTRNIYNWSYHPYDAWDKDGRALPPPVDDDSEAPIAAAVALMRTSEEAIKASTSTGDASLGNTNPNERSGKALEALQSQSDLANSNYPDNVRRAMIYAGELMVEVIPKITRPGQILHIMGMDDKPEQVMIGRPYQVAPDGTPQPAPEHVTPEMARMKDNLYKFYDPGAGKYAVTVTVGKATATRQQEGAKALGDLIPHLPPEMAAVVMPDYVKQLSFPGAQGIAERLESTLPPNLQPKPVDGQPAIPPQAQMQIEQLSAQVQQAQQAIATDQAKQQASIQTAQLKEAGEMERERMRIAADLEKARMDNATRIEVARIGAAKQIASIQAEAKEERLATGLRIDAEQTHDAAMAAVDQAGQREARADASVEAERGRQATAEESERARQATAEEAERNRQAAAEQAAQAAKQERV
jgi:hypothetical protein